VVDQISEIVNALGIVRTTTNDDLELIATLADGTTVSGQHKITAKETKPLKTKITSLYLSDTCASLSDEIRQLIFSADLIVFPPGSFYSSLIANLLPKGVGEAINLSNAKKVFVPNLGNDPELYDTSLLDQLNTLNKTLCTDAKLDETSEMIIDIILSDSILNNEFNAMQARATLKPKLINIDLQHEKNKTLYDEKKLIEGLLSLL
jgi:uncharacterized cofD-like protein